MIGSRAESILLLVLSLVSCNGHQEDACIDHYIEVALPLLRNESTRQTLQFRAQGRSYRIRLWPIEGVFDRNGTVNIVERHRTVTVTYAEYAKIHGIPLVLFVGSVDGDPTSSVRGTVDDAGLFDGHFRSGNVTYYLEPRSRYFHQDSGINRNRRHNAVFYSSTDVRSGTCDHKKARRNGYRQRALRRHSPIADPPVVEAINARYKRDDNLTLVNASMKVCEVKVVADFRFVKYVERVRVDKWPHRVLEDFSRLNTHLLTYDFDEDGRADCIGIEVTTFDIFKVPVRPDLTDTDTWHPGRFFEELGLYDFGGYCAGFLLTSRQMEVSTETPWTASLFKSNPVSYAQGLCSKLSVNIPNVSKHDYGAHFGNALPVNHNESKYTIRSVIDTAQALHQFLHLMGAWDDDHDERRDCLQPPVHRDKRVILKPFQDDLPGYAGQFPVPNSSVFNLKISKCTARAVTDFLHMNGRPCLKLRQFDNDSRFEAGLVTREIHTPRPMPPTPTTSEPTIDDWTEVCFLSETGTGVHHNWTPSLAVLLCGLLHFLL